MPKLTKTLVDNTQIPAAGDTWLWDAEVEGFGVRIQVSGRKTYVVRYRTTDTRTQRKLTIGRVSDMPPERARDLARKIFAEVAEGNDPAEELRQSRAAAGDGSKSVETMFQFYVAHMKNKGAESVSEVERVLLKAEHNAADALGRNKLASMVTTQDVVRFVAGYYKRGFPGAADKARSYVSSAYNWAIKSANDPKVANPRDWGVTVNPAASVARDPHASRELDRNLSISELRQFWQAITNPFANGFTLETAVCLQLMVGTGQRVMETLRLDGAEIDLAERVWNMPIHKTKTKKRPHTVPLPDQLIPWLTDLIALHGDGPLFPGRQGRKRLCHTSVNQAISRWIEMEGVTVELFTPRDIRRTWKSRAHDAGISREWRDLIQQHSKSDTGSKHYDRAEYLPQKREAMAMWSAWIERVLEADEAQQLAA